MEIAPPPRLPARPLQLTAGQGATLGAGPGQPPRSHPSMALELPAVQGEGAALRRHRLPGPQGGWFTATGSEACRRARVGRRQTSSSPALPVAQDSNDIASHQSSVSSSLHGELSRRTHTQDPPSRPLCANRTPRRAPPFAATAADCWLLPASRHTPLCPSSSATLAAITSA